MNFCTYFIVQPDNACIAILFALMWLWLLALVLRIREVADEAPAQQPGAQSQGVTPLGTPSPVTQPAVDAHTSWCAPHAIRVGLGVLLLALAAFSYGKGRSPGRRYPEGRNSEGRNSGAEEGDGGGEPTRGGVIPPPLPEVPTNGIPAWWGHDPYDPMGEDIPLLWRIWTHAPTNSLIAALDRDGDGLDERAEFWYGTDPRRRDTMGDGIDDDWKVRWGLDPLDPGLAGRDTPFPPGGGGGSGSGGGNDGYSNYHKFLLGMNPHAKNPPPTITLTPTYKVAHEGIASGVEFTAATAPVDFAGMINWSVSEGSFTLSNTNRTLTFWNTDPETTQAYVYASVGLGVGGCTATATVTSCYYDEHISLSASPKLLDPSSPTNITIGVTAWQKCTCSVQKSKPVEGYQIEIVAAHLGQNGVINSFAAIPIEGQNVYTIPANKESWTLSWNGIATSGLGQIITGEMFTNAPTPFSRVLPAVTTTQLPPPPFFHIVARLYTPQGMEASKTSERVNVTQIVKVTWDTNVAAVIMAPIVHTNADNTTTLVYTGCSQMEAEEFLGAVPVLAQAKFPSGANIRFVGPGTDAPGAHLMKIIHSDPLRPSYFGRGDRYLCNTEQPNTSGFIYADHIYKEIRQKYAVYEKLGDTIEYDTVTHSNMWANISPPIIPSTLVRLYAGAVAHESGHMVGLALQDLGQSDYHNPLGSPHNYIMNKTTSLDWYLETRGTRYFNTTNSLYLQWVLPKP